MISKEDKLYISGYLDIYGGMLSDKNCEILRQYYDCDMSLNEIAENYSMSRQGVRDIIVRAEGQLKGYETALRLYESRKETLNSLKECVAQLNAGNNAKAQELLSSVVAELEDNYGSF